METSLYSHAAYTRKDLGLQKKLTYEDLVRYLEKDPDKIKYPNRRANITRFSFELSQLDGLGQLELDRQHEQTLRHQERQVLLVRFAQDHNLPLGEVRAYLENVGLHPLHEHELRQIQGGGRQEQQNDAEPIAVAAEPMAQNGVAGGAEPLRPNQQMAAQGVSGQVGHPHPPAEPAPIQLMNRGGVALLPPRPLHNRARSGHGEGLNMVNPEPHPHIQARDFPVVRGQDLALILRNHIFPDAPPVAVPNYARDALVFVPHYVVRNLARAVIQAPHQAEQDHMQLAALQEAIRVEEHARGEVRRVANVAAQGLAQGRRVNVRELLRRGMNADQALDMLLQAGGRGRAPAAEIQDGNQLALAPAPEAAEQPLVLRVNERAAEQDILVRRRMTGKRPAPAAYKAKRRLNAKTSQADAFRASLA